MSGQTNSVPLGEGPLLTLVAFEHHISSYAIHLIALLPRASLHIVRQLSFLLPLKRAERVVAYQNHLTLATPG